MLERDTMLSETILSFQFHENFVARIPPAYQIVIPANLRQSEWYRLIWKILKRASHGSQTDDTCTYGHS